MSVKLEQTLLKATRAAARSARVARGSRAGPGSHPVTPVFRRAFSGSSSQSGPRPGAGSSSSSSFSSLQGAVRQLRLDWTLMVLGAAAGTTATVLYTQSLRTAKLETPALLDDVANEQVVVRSSKKRGIERVISFDELSRHSDEKSLWVAIDGNVWDVTDFWQRHPGGPQILLDHGGQEVTQLFRGIHARGILEKTLSPDLIVGTLDPKSLALSEDTEESLRITKAREALHGVDSIVNLDGFEHYAKDVCPAEAWDYITGGAGVGHAVRNNRDAYERVFFRPRVMRRVSEVDTSADILGNQMFLPVYISATARNGWVQPLGEIAHTIGAGKAGIFQLLSHVSSKGLEEVMEHKADGQKIGWQLYMKPDREKAAEEIKEAARLGASSIWLTVDITSVTKNDKLRLGNAERKPVPHDKPLTAKTGPGLSLRHDANLDWSDVQWIKKTSGGLPVVLKGIGAWEDVVLARQNGASAVVLSNHGGRALDFARAPLETLADVNKYAPEILKDPNFQIFIDGGVRRGADVLKAICLGASAVGMGRPFIFAAATHGSDGVERAVQILHEEMRSWMRMLGVTSLDQLGPQYVDISKL